MKPVPEQKMRRAKKQDQLCRFRACRQASDGQPAQPFQAGHARQQEQAGDRGDVMREKERIEIDAQRENQQANRHPGKPSFT